MGEDDRPIWTDLGQDLQPHDALRDCFGSGIESNSLEA
jgi:hypothetical protein